MVRGIVVMELYRVIHTWHLWD